jgi:hypothetical protein
VHWPPNIGEPLPCAELAWFEPAKFDDWILAERGHGREWQQVFQVGIADAELVWEAIADAVLTATITELREGGNHVGYGVLVELAINARIAPVLTAWHYTCETASPRLVTAYPKPYNRGNGSHA